MGVGQSRMAVVLPGSTAMPAADTIKPRKATDGHRNAHFATLAKSFSTCSIAQTVWRCFLCSAAVQL